MGRLFLVLLTVLLSAGNTLAVTPNTNFTLTSYDVTLTVTDAATTTTTTPNTIGGSVVITMTVSTVTTAPSVISVNFGFGLTLPTTGNISATQIAPGAAATAATPLTFTSSLNRAEETLDITITETFSTLLTVVAITINYQTTINRNNTGFFMRQYLNDDLSNSTMFSTMLKPSYARDLFPCFDEPNLAVPITLSVTRPTTWTRVASSLSVATTGTAASGSVPDTFTALTLPVNALNIFMTTDMGMSTYNSTNSTRLHFWARKGYTGAALENNKAFLASYFYQVQELVGMTFPRPDGLHIVLVPNLEAPYSGYGIVYIRDMNYAVDYSTAQRQGLFKETVVPVVYEFMRQFTEFNSRPATWADSWLSEAMARFLQVTLLNSAGLPIDFAADLNVEARQTAMAMDRPTSSPLENSALDTFTSPIALQLALADPLRSTKGPFLLNMLDMAFPAGTVLSAIKAVLSNTSQSFMTSSSFYAQLNTLATASGAFISSGLTTFETTTNLGLWFSSAGYPQITVSAITAGSPGSLTLNMSEFCDTATCPATVTLPAYSLAATVGSLTNPRYYTPRQDIWVASTTPTVVTSLNFTATDWIVANLQSSGYYRAQYPTAMWTLISAALAKADNAIIGRTQVIDDAFALAFSGRLDISIPLKLAVANMKETLFRNWFPVSMGLNQVRDRLYGLAEYTSFTAYMTPFLQNLNTLLTGTTLDTFQQARISSLFFDSMCEFNVGTFRTTAVNNVSSLLTGTLPTTVLSSNYDSLVCCAARYNGGVTPATAWVAIVATNSTYNIRHYNAIYLGCLSNYTLISTVIPTMLSADKAYMPFILTTFMYLADNHPSEFISTVTAIVVDIEKQIGAPALAGLIYRAGRKINVATSMNAVTASAQVDQEVKLAATNTMAAITTRTTWLSANNLTLVNALSANKLSSTTTSGATLSSMLSLTLLLLLATLAAVL